MALYEVKGIVVMVMMIVIGDVGLMILTLVYRVV